MSVYELSVVPIEYNTTNKTTFTVCVFNNNIYKINMYIVYDRNQSNSRARFL